MATQCSEAIDCRLILALLPLKTFYSGGSESALCIRINWAAFTNYNGRSPPQTNQVRKSSWSQELGFYRQGTLEITPAVLAVSPMQSHPAYSESTVLSVSL